MVTNYTSTKEHQQEKPQLRPGVRLASDLSARWEVFEQEQPYYSYSYSYDSHPSRRTSSSSSGQSSSASASSIIISSNKQEEDDDGGNLQLKLLRGTVERMQQKSRKRTTTTSSSSSSSIWMRGIGSFIAGDMFEKVHDDDYAQVDLNQMLARESLEYNKNSNSSTFSASSTRYTRRK